MQALPAHPPAPASAVAPVIIGFAGLIGAGKTTAALHLVGRHGFERVRFAGPLRAMLRALGLSARELEGDLKERPSRLLGGKTPRYALQSLGTEWGRDCIDPDLWVRAWAAAIEGKPRVVVDDVRFANEVAAIRGLGGRIVRIARPRPIAILTDCHALAKTAHLHISERALPRCDVDVANDGSLEAFLAAVDYVLEPLLSN